MSTIMIVEDDPKINQLLQEQLEKYGFQTVNVEHFDRVMDVFIDRRPDLVLLDVNLPKFDGFYWCRQMRQESNCPILFISARESKMDQVMALENGADDYITKPFDYDVVLAKIRSQLRRAYGQYAPQEGERTVEVAGLKLFLERMELSMNDTKIELSKKEALLLEALMNQYPRVVSRERLLEKLWDEQFVDENTLNVYITRVRGKLKDIGLEGAVETVRGSGYRLRATWEDGQ
ncbi:MULTISPECIES: response regulator transcription factor [Brevibacillus]|jgi:OmpR family two-component system response regulator YxdJ|uniref:DNA-binding response regulator n=1 Tax=Brevibacillus parabrevis TaxID=54914 RepID=A0A4Y3PIN4_BREPA|nr:MULTISPECIES: response regulator transcription factor [Brevibacillus]KZE47973.1 two-component system response regulator [Brevibacillus parabrevis]MBU8715359.1 response regulator transcription factor [Brevibacillus parabrevis]MDH6351967.1 OmpR family two-component system response regulator YxdJ [Brevibacillus sp. 1238]MDR4999699.1 response regulator transcription factor [Brevibacillus parabrevis]MED2257031.1 response regulator transcription factor [Brevibacillus parabrevis]